MRKKWNHASQQDKLLYFGTSETAAKLAPVNGLIAPVILSEVYPGFFCLGIQEKWGIVAVKLQDLLPAAIADFGKKKLKHYGICQYETNIPPHFIAKVAIYAPDSNSFITKLIKEQPDPNIITLRQHKDLYPKNLALTKWLCGENIGQIDPANKLEETNNRSGLDVYYSE